MVCALIYDMYIISTDKSSKKEQEKQVSEDTIKYARRGSVITDSASRCTGPVMWKAAISTQASVPVLTTKVRCTKVMTHWKVFFKSYFRKKTFQCVMYLNVLRLYRASRTEIQAIAVTEEYVCGCRLFVAVPLDWSVFSSLSKSVAIYGSL